MNPDVWFAGGRTATKNGDSVTVSLPKRELRRLGVDPEDLEGETLDAQGEGNEFSVKIPGLAD